MDGLYRSAKMKLIPFIIFILVLAGCDQFNRDHLVGSSFGVNLENISNGKKTQYSDGLFLIYDVEDTELIYRDIFSEPFSKGEVVIHFKNDKFSSDKDGLIWYRQLDTFDGYTKTIFYIPDRKLLGFGYAYSLM